MEEGSEEQLDREESIEEEVVGRKNRGPGEDHLEDLDMNRKK